MEDFPLNKAHEEYRKADSFLRQKKFDECVDSHKKAIEYLEEAITLTENEKVLRSLRTQKEYHEKQMKLVRCKERYLNQIEEEKKNEINNKPSSLPTPTSSDCKDEKEFISNLFEDTESPESLMGTFAQINGANLKSLKSYLIDDNEDNQTANVIGTKLPKDEKATIEELTELKSHMRKLLMHLYSTIDEKNKEIMELKLKVKQLEEEKCKVNSKNSLVVVTDSSGGTSPYVFSPCSELSSDFHDLSTSIPVTSLNFSNPMNTLNFSMCNNN